MLTHLAIPNRPSGRCGSDGSDGSHGCHGPLGRLGQVRLAGAHAKDDVGSGGPRGRSFRAARETHTALHCTHCTAPAPWGLGLSRATHCAFTDCVCDRTATMHHNACLAALAVVLCDGDWVGCKWSPGARYTTLCCSKGPQAQALGGRPHTTRRDPETPSGLPILPCFTEYTCAGALS